MSANDDVTALDALVARLHALRGDAGSPSYGDIAIGVSRARRERGVAPDRSRVGRTTVYDAFRTGRRRLDAELVADIVLAMGGDAALADELAEECRRAQDARPATVLQARDVVTTPARATRTFVVAVLLLSLGANLLGRSLVDTLSLPIYLDMLGTAFSAIVLGPWWGVLVGVSTNVSGAAVSGPDSLWFTPVNVAGALLWGYGVRRWKLGRSIPCFFVLNLIVAVACSLIAVPILLLVYGGGVGHAQDDIAAAVLAVGGPRWLAVLLTNLLTSSVDKLFTGFVALTLIETLRSAVRERVPAGWMRGSPPGGGHQLVRIRSGSVERA